MIVAVGLGPDGHRRRQGVRQAYDMMDGLLHGLAQPFTVISQRMESRVCAIHRPFDGFFDQDSSNPSDCSSGLVNSEA